MKFSLILFFVLRTDEAMEWKPTRGYDRASNTPFGHFEKDIRLPHFEGGPMEKRKWISRLRGNVRPLVLLELDGTDGVRMNSVGCCRAIMVVQCCTYFLRTTPLTHYLYVYFLSQNLTAGRRASNARRGFAEQFLG